MQSSSTDASRPGKTGAAINTLALAGGRGLHLPNLCTVQAVFLLILAPFTAAGAQGTPEQRILAARRQAEQAGIPEPKAGWTWGSHVCAALGAIERVNVYSRNPGNRAAFASPRPTRRAVRKPRAWPKPPRRLRRRHPTR